MAQRAGVSCNVGMHGQAQNQHESECDDIKPLLSSPIEHQDTLARLVKTEPLQIPEIYKRKRLNRTQLRELKASAALRPKTTSFTCKHISKRHDSHPDRWSAHRYQLAEQSMLEILKAKEATFQKPISRPALRMAARKCIGDTGLLDHLLKHIDGKVAPGGVERFRRWFNPDGIMEYWLENADLDNIRQRAGVQDPYWIPPSGGLTSYEDSVSAEELKLLKAELNKMKSDMQELLSKKKEQSEGNQVGVRSKQQSPSKNMIRDHSFCLLRPPNLVYALHIYWQEMFKEIMKWKVEIDQNLNVILSSWKSMQDMYEELIAWKAKLEPQLADMRSMLSSMQQPASSTRVSEGWEDWLESSKLDDVAQGNELLTWFDSTNEGLVNVEQEVGMQDVYSLMPLPFHYGDSPSQGSDFARELEQLSEEMMNANKDVHESVPKNQREEDHVHVNVTPDSSTTANSLSEKSSFVCQEMFVELFNWKAKTEQKLNELSKSIDIIRQPSSKP